MSTALVRTLARKRPESQIQAAILAYLRARGILCWPQNREKSGRGARGARHVGFRGLPDIGGVLPGGRAIHVEVKRSGGKPSPHQVGAMQMLAQQGALVFMASSIEQVEEQLR